MRLATLMLASIVFILLNCTGEDGLTSLIETNTLQPGLECATGGIRITTGIDKNGNGSLDTDEIQSTAFSCNGFNSILKKTAESPGTHCATGGYRLESGIDSNNNGTLEGNEITSSIYICNGDNTYLSYVAALSQTGANSPTASVIFNTLGLTIEWSRLAQGKFKGVLSKPLDLEKSLLLSNSNSLNIRFTSQTEITVENACGVNAYCDGFNNFFFEIKFVK